MGLEEAARGSAPGVFLRGPAGGAGACFACGWPPTTKAIPRDPNYRVQRPCRVLVSRSEFYSLHGRGTQESIKEVTLDRFVRSLNTYCVPARS